MAERLSQIQNFLQQYQADSHMQCTALSGDASFRRYWRVQSGTQHWMLMDAPPVAADCLRFIAVARALAQTGLRVPQVLKAEPAAGLVLMEDLGDDLLQFSLTEDNMQHWYRQALALLPLQQQVRDTSEGPLPAFDRAFVLRELQIFTDWFLPVHLHLPIDSATQALLDTSFGQIADEVLTQPQAGMHRDFHSRNLMILPDRSLAVIDFQDAVVGPVSYDAVSLLRDCYLRWPDADVALLRDEFYQSLQQQLLVPADYTLDQFRRAFDWTGLQRHLKVCGIFARLYHRDHKAGYLADLPRVVGYVVDIAKQYPELSAFSHWFEQVVLPRFAEVRACGQ
ncbi:aminoglycoside phosphotransferase family protein [Rheinheimera texasensis]|uniref:aminoglycoside phosphotransferase family protein n=1 Tax=Rheinheimera texasensis TaxID=306205 RepID=UPI0004E22756|nr:phosphotransferase [Rheinheimera texasensis]